MTQDWTDVMNVTVVGKSAEAPVRVRSASFADYISIARIDHWFKNVFILPGAALALALGARLDASLVWKFPLGVLAICLIASANYTINEWLDREFDRHHPIKRTRASVVADIRSPPVYLQWCILAAAGLALGLLISVPFALTALALLVMGLIYNVPPVRSKDRPYVDVLSEAINNPIRLLAGWFILAPPIVAPSSVLLCYWFGGAYLMAIKRFAEYKTIDDPALAGLYRASFKYYNDVKLLVSAVVYAILSTAFLGVFLTKYKVELLLSLPLVAGLFGWYLAVGLARDSIAQTPERLYKQRGMVVFILFIAAFLTGLLFVDIPIMQEMLEIKRISG